MRDSPLRNADLLWPLLEPKVRALTQAVANVAIVAGIGEHDLGGSQHKGVLRNDQAPQFLLADGTRPLTGNLAVAANATVDGVDISAHAADPNAHHARSHDIISGDHTVTGSQYQLVGLAGVNALGLLTPSFNPVAAAAILRTDTAGKLTLKTLDVTDVLYVDGTLDLGVDTIYEDSTYLRVDGSKPVRFAQAVGGTAWGISALGVFTGTGGAFSGNVDIINGGDLTVAGSGAYAGLSVLFVDSSGGNVGINRVPDSQFALDVAGPARADYFIGQHAIQLRDVLLLSHFDGRAPFETNYTGDPNGHMGQVGTATGGLIFPLGKFGKAAQFAETTTNLVPNPSFEVNTTGWTHTNGSGLSAFARLSADSCYGAYSLLATNTAAGADDYFSVSIGGLTAGATYVVSAWVNVPAFTAGALANRGLFAYDTADIATQQTAAITGVTAGWVRLSVIVTTTAAAGSHTVAVRLYAPQGTTYWDAVQMEQKAYLTPYCDGSLGGYSASGVPDGSGHAWTGTPHASTSTRAAAALSYPTAGNIDPAAGTIMAWVRPTAISGTQEILNIVGTGAGFIVLRLNTGRLQFYAGTNAVLAPVGTALPANVWSHVAATYDGTTARIYVNGVQVASGASSGFSGMPAGMGVGRWLSSPAWWLNGSIDDLCILPYVAAPMQIRSIYESNAPVFAETSVFVFRATPRGLVWGDDEGLWVRDTVGNPVLGVYGGAAATKSWAGWSDMAVGDVIIGRNLSGASALRWTQATGKFGFYGNGNALPQVEISTNGDLWAAAGLLQVGAYGLRLRKVGTTDAILLNGDGLLMGSGGARASHRDWTTGSRFHWLESEIYQAAAETYTNGVTTFERNPLVIRNVGDSPVGNVGTAMTELAAVTNTKTAKILLAAGVLLEDYTANYGTYSVVDLQTDLVLLNEAVLRGQRYAYLGVEWMRFDGTVGATNPISGGALGAYVGKLKINVNGTDRWIPYYA